MSSGKWLPVSLGLNVLTQISRNNDDFTDFPTTVACAWVQPEKDFFAFLHGTGADEFVHEIQR